MVFRILKSMKDIEAAQWQSLVRAETSPFLEYYWLAACESSGSMVPDTGWQTCHVVGFLSSSDAEQYNRPVFILPLYIKSHSWGEFVFDFAWVDIANQLQQEYYPKAVGLVPATPIPAYEPLATPGCEKMLTAALNFIRQKLLAEGVKSLSFLFTTAAFATTLAELGYSRWVHQGFEWRRAGMNGFHDYLAGFRKNQRKNIRKERQSMIERGISVRIYQDEELNESLADDMYALYAKTNEQFGPWAAKFFNAEFFREIFRSCAGHIVLVSAENADGYAIGRSMLVVKNRMIFGRYWGCHEFVKNLHFNLCYYEPIDLAIRRGLGSFDPGMGGEHKARRGFRSVERYSMHTFFNPIMDRVFADNIFQFNDHALKHIALLNESGT